MFNNNRLAKLRQEELWDRRRVCDKFWSISDIGLVSSNYSAGKHCHRNGLPSAAARTIRIKDRLEDKLSFGQISQMIILSGALVTVLSFVLTIFLKWGDIKRRIKGETR